MKSTILVLAVLVTVFSSSTIYAQSTAMIVEDVVLFNNKAYMVKMTPKGKIIEFVRDVENSYSALNKHKAQVIEMSQDAVIAAIDLGRKGGNTLDVAAYRETLIAKEQMMKEKKSKKATENAIVQTPEDGTDMMENAVADSGVNPDEEMTSKGVSDTETVSSSSTTNYAYEFAFDHRDASLSPSSENQLDEIAKIMKEDTTTSLEINSYFSESVDISRILSKNRAKGIHDTLVSKGIDSSRIKISESNNEDWANNRVKVSIH
jgi:outer membrane protein OmpA-like peptidoglycan-associated protein